MPSLYESDDKVPPIHIGHYPAKRRESHRADAAPKALPEDPPVHEVSYEELMLTSSLDIAQAALESSTLEDDVEPEAS